jgi:hypothetical protein
MMSRGRAATVLAAQLLVGWAVASKAMPLGPNTLSTFVVRGRVVDLQVKNGSFVCRVWQTGARSFGPAFNFPGPAIGVPTSSAVCTEQGDCYVDVEYSDMSEVWRIAFNAELNAATAEKVWSGPDDDCHMLDRIDGAIVMFGDDRVTILGNRACRVVDDESLHVVGGWSHANGHLYAPSNSAIAEWRIGNFATCAPLQFERTVHIRGTNLMDVQATPAVVAAMMSSGGGHMVLTLSDSLDPFSVLPLSLSPPWFIESTPEGVAVWSFVSRRLWVITDRFNAIEYERPAMTDDPVLLNVNGRLTFADGKSVVEPVVKRRIRLAPYEAPVSPLLVFVVSVLVLMAGVTLATVAFVWRRSSISA